MWQVVEEEEVVEVELVEVDIELVEEEEVEVGIEVEEKEEVVRSQSQRQEEIEGVG